MINTIQAYKTEDGKIFEYKDDALDHSSLIYEEQIKKIELYIYSLFSRYRINNFWIKDIDFFTNKNIIRIISKVIIYNKHELIRRLKEL